MADPLNLTRELQRKSIHILISVIPLAYYFGGSKQFILGFSFTLTIGFLIAEILRMNFSLAEKYFTIIFHKLLRFDEQKKQLTGASYLFLGMTLTFFLFPKEEAIPAVLFLTVADSAAAIIGKWCGGKIILEKTLQGSLAFFLTAVFIIWALTDFGWPGIGIAFMVTLIEFLPIGVNDNLSIPLAGGAFLYYLA